MLMFGNDESRSDDESDQIQRRLFVMQCSNNVGSILKPTARNPRLSEIHRYFDNLCTDSSDASIYIPKHIQQHLQDLGRHIEHRTTLYWLYTLSYYIQEWILDAGSLKADIEAAIGEENLAPIRSLVMTLYRSRTEVENGLCRAYFAFLAQYMHRADFHVPELHSFSKIIVKLNFCNHDILVARKQTLLNQYKLCIDSTSHLSFWSQYSYEGFWGQGGVRVEHYFIPNTVHEIMQQCTPHTTEPYDHFVARINALRHQPSFFSFGRHPVTRLFYDLPDSTLETTTVEEIVERSQGLGL